MGDAVIKEREHALVPGAVPIAKLLPLGVTPPFLAHSGTRSALFNIQSDHETVGVTTDVGEACAASRAEYRAKADGGTLRLDFGLWTLFVSDRGDIVGAGFLGKLASLDRS